MSAKNDQMFNALQSLVEGCELTLDDLKNAIIDHRAEDGVNHLMVLIPVPEGVMTLLRKATR